MDGVKREFSNKNQSESDQKYTLEARLAKVKAGEVALKQSQTWKDYENYQNQLGFYMMNLMNGIMVTSMQMSLQMKNM